MVFVDRSYLSPPPNYFLAQANGQQRLLDRLAEQKCKWVVQMVLETSQGRLPALSTGRWAADRLKPVVTTDLTFSKF